MARKLLILLSFLASGCATVGGGDRCQTLRALADSTCRLVPGEAACAEARAAAQACEGTQPAPTPVPDPEPDGPPDGSPVCQPGARCGCSHRPPGQDWQRLPDCAPVPTCVIPDGEEGRDVHRVDPQPAGDPAAAEALRRAIRTLRPGCPDGISPRCPVGVSLDAWRAEVVAQLGRDGVCAGLQGGADEVCVLVGPGRCQGWRVGTCGGDPIRGCLEGGGVVVAWPTEGAVRDTWVTGPGSSPEPQPTPEPGDTTCDPGTPDVGRYQIESRPRAGGNRAFVTATPKVTGNQPYCSTHNADPRAQINCPFWPEGHPKRADCERKHGWPVWFSTLNAAGEGVVQREDNPFSADAPRGVSATVCHRESCTDPGNQATCRMCSGPQVIP